MEEKLRDSEGEMQEVIRIHLKTQVTKVVNKSRKRITMKMSLQNKRQHCG